MIRSMTGYGEAEQVTPAGTLTAEIRTVNHRHFHANFRLPALLARWETEVREVLRGVFARGAVNCSVRFEAAAGDVVGAGMQLDDERVRAYLALFAQLGERFGVSGQVDIGTITRFSDIIRRDEPEALTLDVGLADVQRVAAAAAARAVAMREDEGGRLRHDLEGRLDAIDGALDEVERLAPERLRRERNRLRDAVRELAEGVAVSEERLAQEIAFIAERWDVNEELVRFRSHNTLFRELLAAPADEAVGKRLSFLVQEMHREANTVGSKANDARISHCVVAIKDEVERLREQVENVE